MCEVRAAAEQRASAHVAAAHRVVNWNTKHKRCTRSSSRHHRVPRDGDAVHSAAPSIHAHNGGPHYNAAAATTTTAAAAFTIYR